MGLTKDQREIKELKKQLERQIQVERNLTQKLAESRGQIFMANQSIIKLTKANAIRSAFMKYLHDRFGKEHVNQTPHGEIEAGLLIFAAGEAHKNPPINGAAKEQITKKIGAANAS